MMPRWMTAYWDVLREYAWLTVMWLACAAVLIACWTVAR